MREVSLPVFVAYYIAACVALLVILRLTELVIRRLRKRG